MKLKIKKEWLYKIVLIILSILVIYVTYCSIFEIYRDPVGKMNPIIIIFGIIICICIFIKMNKIVDKISEKKINWISICLCILFFIALSVFGSKMVAVPTYDLSDIQKEVQIMLSNGGNIIDEESYFSIYSAQQPILILIYFIYKLGDFLGVSNLKIFTTIIDSAFISVSAFFTYLSVKKAKNYKVGFITLIFFIINPIFYCYNSWFYTDTFCMPFAAIAIYLFICAIKQEDKKKSIICYISSGLFLAIGFKIRVVVGILLIGMIIGMIMNDKFSKKLIKNIMCLFIGFIIGIFICKLIMLPFNIKTDKDKEIPPTHWMMMSLNADSHGGWNKEDFDNTLEQTTYNDKVKFNLETIKDRLKELRVKGLIELSKLKLARNWSNGEYDYIYKLDNVENIDVMYEYVVGNRRAFLLYYCQILKATVMFVFLIAIFKEIYKPEENGLHNYIYISVFGAFLFYLIWEVCPRYSFSFLPWIMLTFGTGITYLGKIFDIDKVKFKLKNNKTINFNIQKAKEIALIGIIVCTILLLGINYFELTVDKQYYWDKRVVVQTTNNIDTKNLKISNNTIEQTFKTSKSFNSIAVRFKNEGTSAKTNYVFAVCDASGEEIRNKKFDSYSIIDNEWKTFNFKKIKPNGEEEYTIKIYSDDATEKNSIGLVAFYKDGFSIYPNGQVQINGEFNDVDLMFRVQYKNKRTYTSKKVFIILSIIILSLEIYGFYPYIKNSNQEILEEKKK